jgi:hypothetical protein
LGATTYLVVVYIFLLVVILLVAISLPRVSVNPEYINGVLTASSILFGFWFIMLEIMQGRKPKDEQFLSRPIKISFLSSMGFLICTVMLLYATALSNSAVLSEMTLGIATISFVVNITLVIFILLRLK